MQLERGVRFRALVGAAASLGAIAVFAGAASSALAAPPVYNLSGVFISGPLEKGVRSPQNGTAYVTSMNMQTGAFSGHSEVEGVDFALQGSENGTEVNYTQSEGGYVAHDHIPHVSQLANGHIGGDGSFESGEFWMETSSAPQVKHGKARAFVTVLCNIFPSAPSTSNCTTDVGSLEGVQGPVPTGSVRLTTTTGTLQEETCSLQLAIGLGSVASCTVGFTPAPETPEGVPLPVVGHYSGDSHFAPAEGSTSPVAPVLGGSFAEASSNGSFVVPLTNSNAFEVSGEISVSTGGAAGAIAAVHATHFRIRPFRVDRVHLRLRGAALAKLRHKKRLKVTIQEHASVRGHRLRRSFTLLVRRRRR